MGHTFESALRSARRLGPAIGRSTVAGVNHLSRGAGCFLFISGLLVSIRATGERVRKSEEPGGSRGECRAIQQRNG